MVFGVALWLRHPVVSGVALLCGAVATGLAAVWSTNTGVPTLILPLLFVTVGAAANGFMFVAEKPVNPFRPPRSTKIWSIDRHVAVIIAFVGVGLATATGSAISAMVGHVGASIAFLALTAGAATFAAAVLISAVQAYGKRR